MIHVLMGPKSVVNIVGKEAVSETLKLIDEKVIDRSGFEMTKTWARMMEHS